MRIAKVSMPALGQSGCSAYLISRSGTSQVEELIKEVEILSQNHEREIDRKVGFLLFCSIRTRVPAVAPTLTPTVLLPSPPGRHHPNAGPRPRGGRRAASDGTAVSPPERGRAGQAAAVEAPGYGTASSHASPWLPPHAPQRAADVSTCIQAEKDLALIEDEFKHEFDDMKADTPTKFSVFSSDTTFSAPFSSCNPHWFGLTFAAFLCDREPTSG